MIITESPTTRRHLNNASEHYLQAELEEIHRLRRLEEDELAFYEQELASYEQESEGIEIEAEQYRETQNRDAELRNQATELPHDHLREALPGQAPLHDSGEGRQQQAQSAPLIEFELTTTIRCCKRRRRCETTIIVRSSLSSLSSSSSLS